MTTWSFTSEGVILASHRIPITRGQLMLLMAATNLAFLGIDIWMAHLLNGTIRPKEWIPIIFGPTAAVILLITGLISLRRRTLAILLAFVVLGASLVVGLLGMYFHLNRAVPPSGFQIDRLQEPGVILLWFVYAPPIVGPLVFSLVAILGIIAAVYEDPPDSGRMVIPGVFSWQVPFSKTRQYIIWVSLGILATLMSSVLDHGRVNFENPWVWVPTISGIFAAVAGISLGLIPHPSRSDYAVYIVSMAMMILVGLIGFILHIRADLTTHGDIVIERFLRGAPFLAPMLFADMGTLGLIALWPIEEKLER